MNVQHLTNEEKLNEIFRMTEENNTILRSMRRTQYISNIFRLLYWTLIIASLGGAYYFIKPIITGFSENEGGVSDTLKQLNILKSQLPEVKLLQEMLTGAKGAQAQ
jgi:site-specific recombinase